MRAIRLLLATCTLALAFVVLLPSTSYACSCVTRSVAAHVADADLVVAGVVVDREPPPMRPVTSSGDPATYTLTVDTVLKGAAHRTTRVLSADSGASCGLEHVRVGRRYLVFAHQSKGASWASLCGGTGPAAPAFVRDVEAVTGSGSRPAADSAPLPRFNTDGLPDDTPRARRVPVWSLAVGGAGALGLLIGATAVVLVVRANRGP